MDPRTPRFLLKACVRCGGDLALDDGDWQCLQCGRYYYVRRNLAPPPPGEVLSRWREQLRRPSPSDAPPPPQQGSAPIDALGWPRHAVVITRW
jgi:hypothetical protein